MDVHGSPIVAWCVQVAEATIVDDDAMELPAHRRPEVGVTWHQRYRGSELACVVDEVVAGQGYWVRVAAVNDQGTSPYSVPEFLQLPPDAPAPPEKPKCKLLPRLSATKFVATLSSKVAECVGDGGDVAMASIIAASSTAVRDTGSNAAALLQWQPPLADCGDAVTSYVVHMCEQSSASGGTFTCIYEGPAPALCVLCLAPGSSYKFRVHAQSNAGLSARTDTVSCTYACSPARLCCR